MSPRKAKSSASSDGSPPDADREAAPALGEDGAPLDDPSQRRLPPLLRQAWFALNQAFRRRLAHLSITPDQFTILRWLLECDAAGPTQRELATMMASDANTIASLLSRMEDAGFIERAPHESDRRANRVRLKPKGKRVYEKARDIAVQLQADILRVLPENDRERFLKQLEVIGNACRSALEDS